MHLPLPIVLFVSLFPAAFCCVGAGIFLTLFLSAFTSHIEQKLLASNTEIVLTKEMIQRAYAKEYPLLFIISRLIPFFILIFGGTVYLVVVIILLSVRITIS